jgi:hypothetical protein
MGLSLHMMECALARPVAEHLPQVIQQRFRVFQIRCIETLGEPSIDVGEDRARLVGFALRCEQPREA